MDRRMHPINDEPPRGPEAEELYSDEISLEGYIELDKRFWRIAKRLMRDYPRTPEFGVAATRNLVGLWQPARHHDQGKQQG